MVSTTTMHRSYSCWVALLLVGCIACNDGVSSPSPGPSPSSAGPPSTPAPTPPSAQASSYRFSGAVLDSLDQAPVAGARVSIASDDRSIDTFAWTDSRGGYEITASSPKDNETVGVSTTQDGYVTQIVQRVVSAGSVTIDVRLVPAPFTLVGTVQDNQNRDAPFCEPIRVEAVTGQSAGRSIQVSRPGDGSFQFGSLQPGTFTVRASAPGYYIRETTARLRGVPPFNRLDFLLPRGPQPADGTRVDCNRPPLQ